MKASPFAVATPVSVSTEYIRLSDPMPWSSNPRKSIPSMTAPAVMPVICTCRCRVSGFPLPKSTSWLAQVRPKMARPSRPLTGPGSGTGSTGGGGTVGTGGSLGALGPLGPPLSPPQAATSATAARVKPRKSGRRIVVDDMGPPEGWR